MTEIKKNKILLIYPRISSNPNPPIAPYGLLLLGSFLSRLNYKIEIIDEHYTNLDSFLESNIDDVILCCISCTMSPQFKNINKLIKLISSLKISIVIGGAYTSLDYQRIASILEVDYLHIGYGFEQIMFILKELSLKRENVYQRKNILLNSEFPTELPLIEYSLIDVQNYIYFEQEHKSFSIMSSMGCTNGCSFCINSINKKWIGYSANEVFNIISFFNCMYDIEYFRFIDDNPFQKPSRILKIVEMCKKSNLSSIRFYFDIPINIINSNIFDVISPYVYKVYTGIETPSINLQSKLHKVILRSEIEKAVAKLNKYGILAKYSFIVSLPNEKEDDIEELKELLHWLKINHPLSEISIKKYMPLPKTPLSKKLKISEYYFPNESLEINQKNFIN